MDSHHNIRRIHIPWVVQFHDQTKACRSNVKQKRKRGHVALELPEIDDGTNFFKDLCKLFFGEVERNVAN